MSSQLHPSGMTHAGSHEMASGMTDAHRAGKRHEAMVDGGGEPRGRDRPSGDVDREREARFERHQSKSQRPPASTY